MNQRWTDLTEISYDEMVDLAKMNAEERGEIRQFLGYKKIVNTCSRLRGMSTSGCGWTLARQAKQRRTIRGVYKRGYATWTSMLLRGVRDPFCPTDRDDMEYPKSDGWPEWFSHGWTLQEMIAPNNVQCFDTN